MTDEVIITLFKIDFEEYLVDHEEVEEVWAKIEEQIKMMKNLS